MADELSGADIRGRFRQSDDSGDPSSAPPPTPSSGADIRQRFRAADEAAPQTTLQQAPSQDYTTFAGAPPDETNLSASPTSLEDARSAIQRGDINALNWEKAHLGTGVLGQAAMVGTHLLAGAAQLPVNALIGLSQGPGANALTIDPSTNAVRLTPEAVTAGSLAATPLRFSGSVPSAFVPPSGTLDRTAPLPSEFTANPLTPEGRTAAAAPPGGPTTPTGVSPPPPQAAPATPAGTPAAAPTARPDIMPAADIKGIAKGYYTPANQAAAAGSILPQDSANAVRSAVTNLMPDNPETAKYFARGNPTVAAVIKDVTDSAGQPMSYDSAMELDQTLSGLRRATRDPREKSLLGQALDGVRSQMDQVPDLDNLKPGRQAYGQYIKQQMMEDINDDASLLPEERRDAYIRNRATALLRNDSKMANWTDDEKTQLRDVATSGNVGKLTSFGLSLFRPVGRMVGGYAGSSFGPIGALIGSEGGAEIGGSMAARVRRNQTQTSLDQVMQQITQGVPPPNPLTRPPP